MHRSTHRLFYLTLIVMLLFPAMAVLAAPPALPASFYGRARVSGSNASAGSTIFVYVGDLELAYVPVVQDATYGSVYTMNIPADNPDTALVDGGQEGNVLTFYIQLPNMQRIKATRTAVWSSGSSVALDLNFGDGSNIYLPMITLRYSR